MNRWQNGWFSNLHADSKLLYIYISENCDKECWFDVSMAKVRIALNPLSDPEIKAAFKEISPLCEITPDKKRLRLIACKEAGMLPFDEDELKKSRKKFIPPNIDEVRLVIKDKKLAQKFMNHYISNGWKVGRNKMIDWQAAANNWAIEFDVTSHEGDKKLVINL